MAWKKGSILPDWLDSLFFWKKATLVTLDNRPPLPSDTTVTALLLAAMFSTNAVHKGIQKQQWHNSWRQSVVACEVVKSISDLTGWHKRSYLAVQCHQPTEWNRCETSKRCKNVSSSSRSDSFCFKRVNSSSRLESGIKLMVLTGNFKGRR